MDDLRGQIGEAEAGGWTCPDPSLSELWSMALQKWVIDADASQAALNRWTRLVVWFAQRFRANGIVGAITPLVDCVQRGHDFALGAELEIPADSKTSPAAIDGFADAFDGAGKSLSELRQIYVQLGLIARKQGKTLSSDCVVKFNSQRRILANMIATFVGELNGKIDAYNETLADLPFGSLALKAGKKERLPDNLGTELLDRIPLLPKEILPKEYQQYPAYPSLTAEEEATTAAGLLPALPGWMIGTALMGLCLGIAVWLSTDAIMAVFAPKALAEMKEIELMKQQAKGLHDAIKDGVTPDLAAKVTQPHTPQDPPGGGGGSIWGWILGLLGLGIGGVMLAKSRAR